MMHDRRTHARLLAKEAVSQGKPLEWFEVLYSLAARGEATIPWADMTVNPNLAEWLETRRIDGSNRRALVVGCGLGDDSEAIASLGFQVTAFDISPSCIDWCRRRFADSSVKYQVVDLFRPPADWAHAFDFVFEAYTLQVLPADLRPSAMERIAEWVANDGTLLITSRGRDESDDPGQMPWPLLRAEFGDFARHGMTEVQFEDYVDAEQPPVRRFRVEYRRQNRE